MTGASPVDYRVGLMQMEKAMTVISNEDPANPSVHEPRVTGSPDAIWLVYGDIEQDATHRECSIAGDVMWCDDAQFPADVSYTRTDLVAERVRAAVSAERERWQEVVFDGWRVLQGLDERAQKRTSHQNVSDVLDALVRVMKPNTTDEPRRSAASDSI